MKKIIRIALEKFADRFLQQKNAIFGFGKNADNARNVFKMSTATPEELGNYQLGRQRTPL